MIWIIGWILLWFRPEYKFVLFFALGLTILNLIFLVLFSGIPAVIFNDGVLDPYAFVEFLVLYLLQIWITVGVFFAVGAAIVALRKWMKSRKPAGDDKLDAEMERIRADIAARDGQPPAAQ